MDKNKYIEKYKKYFEPGLQHEETVKQKLGIKDTTYRNWLYDDNKKIAGGLPGRIRIAGSRYFLIDIDDFIPWFVDQIVYDISNPKSLAITIKHKAEGAL